MGEMENGTTGNPKEMENGTTGNQKDPAKVDVVANSSKKTQMVKTNQHSMANSMDQRKENSSKKEREKAKMMMTSTEKETENSKVNGTEMTSTENGTENSKVNGTEMTSKVKDLKEKAKVKAKEAMTANFLPLTN